jgi:hypothetical protein
VLDNTDNKLDFFPESDDVTAGLARFVPHSSKGTVVVTTRDHEVGDLLTDMNGAFQSYESGRSEGAI